MSSWAAWNDRFAARQAHAAGDYAGASRLARRAAMGLARVGSVAGNGSGDLFIAFSTANARAIGKGGVETYQALSDDDVETLDFLYEAVIQATEEAIVNALLAAETMTGIVETVTRSLKPKKKDTPPA